MPFNYGIKQMIGSFEDAPANNKVYTCLILFIRTAPAEMCFQLPLLLSKILVKFDRAS